MAFNYLITKTAYDDIDNALDYIANKLLNVSAAKNLYDEIQDKINKICKEELYTKDCRVYGIEDETIRRINKKKYILVFKIDYNIKQIIVLRLLHETQNVAKILESLTRIKS